MAGLARIAAESGHRVTGSDAALHPPMSVQLQEAGIECRVGDDPAQLEPPPDCVVVGNVMTRGRPVVEALLSSSIPYASGPQWLGEHVLRERHVLAVAGTHGKTTTAAMLTHMLGEAGLEPGYLIGGVPAGTQRSAQAGRAPYFVIEADEYDTAFFDKRSKFVHYRPRTLVLNNLEYDHADIFDDVAAIRRQFHHLLRIVPGDGRILCRADDPQLQQVLAMGCWTPVETFGFGEDCDWACLWQPGEELVVRHGGREYRAAGHRPLGAHNALNATAAVAAAAQAGVSVEAALEALASFAGVLRRLNRHTAALGEVRGELCLYDDFAHHPTEIEASIRAVREQHPGQAVLAVVDMASNSMRLGAHRDMLEAALQDAAQSILCISQELQWDAQAWAQSKANIQVAEGFDALAEQAASAWQELSPAAVVLVMSNRPGSDVCEKLKQRLAALEASGANDEHH